MASELNYFSTEIKVLRFFGVSLNEKESTAYKIFSFFILTTSCAYAALAICEFTQHTFNEIAEYIVFPMGCIIATGKTITVLLNIKRVRTVLHKFSREPFLAIEERGGKIEQELLEECVLFTNVQRYVYLACGVIVVGSVLIFNIILHFTEKNFRELPFGPITLFNKNSDYNYWYWWLYQCYCLAVHCMRFIMADLITASSLAHISYQLKILQNCLQRIFYNSYRDMLKDQAPSSLEDLQSFDTFEIDNSKIEWKYLHQRLWQVVEYHLSIMEITSEIGQIFSFLFLFVLLNSLVALSILIYHFTMSEIATTFEMVEKAIEIFGIIFQVTLVCYWSDEIKTQSEKIGSVILELDFVGCDVRLQKSLCLIIRQSFNPLRLSAAKMVDMNLQTWTWMLKTSFSAFAMLKTINSEDK